MAVARIPLTKEKERILSLQRMQLRLHQILSSVSSWKKGAKESCVFVCVNSFDIDPAFRGEIKGIIYIDNNNLCVELLPDKDFAKAPPRLEIVLENISHFSIKFFDSAEGKWTESYPQIKPFMVKGSFDNMEIPFFL
jgi:hypothetical protein